MFKVLKNGTAPTRGSEYSACVDLYASETVTIGAGEAKVIGLGVCIDIPDIYKHDDFKKSHYLQLMLRSSLGKKGLILPNGVGIIDLDYEDEIKMIIHNPITPTNYIDDELGIIDSEFFCPNSFEIKKGDKIGQITLLEHKSRFFDIKSDVKRSGGFGSSDEKN